MSFVRFQSTSNPVIDDQRLRDYLHRLFDICYQINGIYFAHDTELYSIKVNDESYFLTSFLQQVLFQNLNTLPSIRLRIVLRHFCRLFTENYSAPPGDDKDVVNELFLTFLDVFLPYIEQRLNVMWTNLLTTTTATTYQQGECSEEVIEECVCVLITRDFVDITRHFIFKTIPGQTNANSANPGKKKSKIANGRNNSESMCEDTNGDLDQIDDWDEQAASSSITNKLLNNAQDKMDYSDLFTYMLKMARQSECRFSRAIEGDIAVFSRCSASSSSVQSYRANPVRMPNISRRLLYQSLSSYYSSNHQALQ